MEIGKDSICIFLVEADDITKRKQILKQKHAELIKDENKDGRNIFYNIAEFYNENPNDENNKKKNNLLSYFEQEIFNKEINNQETEFCYRVLDYYITENPFPKDGQINNLAKAFKEVHECMTNDKELDAKNNTKEEKLYKIYAIELNKLSETCADENQHSSNKKRKRQKQKYNT
jgi:hypothetical protein